MRFISTSRRCAQAVLNLSAKLRCSAHFSSTKRYRLRHIARLLHPRLGRQRTDDLTVAAHQAHFVAAVLGKGDGRRMTPTRKRMARITVLRVAAVLRTGDLRGVEGNQFRIVHLLTTKFSVSKSIRVFVTRQRAIDEQSGS
mgnify:CR=1 FL=1